MMRPLVRAAVLAAASLPVVLGAGLGVHAHAAATPDAPPVAAPQPVITIVRDTPHAAAPLPATAPRAASAPGAMPPPDQSFLGAAYGKPSPLPPAGSSCATQPPVHFDGFASMRGSGQDVVTQPDGSSTSYQAYATHVAAQYTCTEATPSGGLRVMLRIIPVSADQSTYVFDMGPAGLTLQSIAPGVSQTRGDFLTVNRRLGDWVSPSCLGFAAPDLGPRHAAIDDTFCFAPDGILQHAVLHEKATDVNGIVRDLQVTLDLLR